MTSRLRTGKSPTFFTVYHLVRNGMSLNNVNVVSCAQKMYCDVDLCLYMSFWRIICKSFNMPFVDRTKINSNCALKRRIKAF